MAGDGGSSGGGGNNERIATVSVGVEVDLSALEKQLEAAKALLDKAAEEFTLKVASKFDLQGSLRQSQDADGSAARDAEQGNAGRRRGKNRTVEVAQASASAPRAGAASDASDSASVKHQLALDVTAIGEAISKSVKDALAEAMSATFKLNIDVEHLTEQINAAASNVRIGVAAVQSGPAPSFSSSAHEFTAGQAAPVVGGRSAATLPAAVREAMTNRLPEKIGVPLQQVMKRVWSEYEASVSDSDKGSIPSSSASDIEKLVHLVDRFYRLGDTGSMVHLQDNAHSHIGQSASGSGGSLWNFVGGRPGELSADALSNIQWLVNSVAGDDRLGSSFASWYNQGAQHGAVPPNMAQHAAPLTPGTPRPITVSAPVTPSSGHATQMPPSTNPNTREFLQHLGIGDPKMYEDITQSASQTLSQKINPFITMPFINPTTSSSRMTDDTHTVRGYLFERDPAAYAGQLAQLEAEATRAEAQAATFESSKEQARTEEYVNRLASAKKETKRLRREKPHDSTLRRRAARAEARYEAALNRRMGRISESKIAATKARQAADDFRGTTWAPFGADNVPRSARGNLVFDPSRHVPDARTGIIEGILITGDDRVGMPREPISLAPLFTAARRGDEKGLHGWGLVTQGPGKGEMFQLPKFGAHHPDHVNPITGWREQPFSPIIPYGQEAYVSETGQTIKHLSGRDLARQFLSTMGIPKHIQDAMLSHEGVAQDLAMALEEGRKLYEQADVQYAGPTGTRFAPAEHGIDATVLPKEDRGSGRRAPDSLNQEARDYYTWKQVRKRIAEREAELSQTVTGSKKHRQITSQLHDLGKLEAALVDSLNLHPGNVQTNGLRNTELDGASGPIQDQSKWAKLARANRPELFQPEPLSGTGRMSEEEIAFAKRRGVMDMPGMRDLWEEIAGVGTEAQTGVWQQPENPTDSGLTQNMNVRQRMNTRFKDIFLRPGGLRDLLGITEHKVSYESDAKEHSAQESLRKAGFGYLADDMDNLLAGHFAQKEVVNDETGTLAPGGGLETQTQDLLGGDDGSDPYHNRRRLTPESPTRITQEISLLEQQVAKHHQQQAEDPNLSLSSLLERTPDQQRLSLLRKVQQDVLGLNAEHKGPYEDSGRGWKQRFLKKVKAAHPDWFEGEQGKLYEQEILDHLANGRVPGRFGLANERVSRPGLPTADEDAQRRLDLMNGVAPGQRPPATFNAFGRMTYHMQEQSVLQASMGADRYRAAHGKTVAEIAAELVARDQAAFEQEHNPNAWMPEGEPETRAPNPLDIDYGPMRKPETQPFANANQEQPAQGPFTESASANAQSQEAPPQRENPVFGPEGPYSFTMRDADKAPSQQQATPNHTQAGTEFVDHISPPGAPDTSPLGNGGGGGGGGGGDGSMGGGRGQVHVIIDGPLPLPVRLISGATAVGGGSGPGGSMSYKDYEETHSAALEMAQKLARSGILFRDEASSYLSQVFGKGIGSSAARTAYDDAAQVPELASKPTIQFRSAHEANRARETSENETIASDDARQQAENWYARQSRIRTYVDANGNKADRIDQMPLPERYMTHEQRRDAGLAWWDKNTNQWRQGGRVIQDPGNVDKDPQWSWDSADRDAAMVEARSWRQNETIGQRAELRNDAASRKEDAALQARRKRNQANLESIQAQYTRAGVTIDGELITMEQRGAIPHRWMTDEQRRQGGFDYQANGQWYNSQHQPISKPLQYSGPGYDSIDDLIAQNGGDHANAIDISNTPMDRARRDMEIRQWRQNERAEAATGGQQATGHYGNQIRASINRFNDIARQVFNLPGINVSSPGQPTSEKYYGPEAWQAQIANTAAEINASKRSLPQRALQTSMIQIAEQNLGGLNREGNMALLDPAAQGMGFADFESAPAEWRDQQWMRYFDSSGAYQRMAMADQSKQWVNSVGRDLRTNQRLRRDTSAAIEEGKASLPAMLEQINNEPDKGKRQKLQEAYDASAASLQGLENHAVELGKQHEALTKEMERAGKMTKYMSDNAVKFGDVARNLGAGFVGGVAGAFTGQLMNSVMQVVGEAITKGVVPLFDRWSGSGLLTSRINEQYAPALQQAKYNQVGLMSALGQTGMTGTGVKNVLPGMMLGAGALAGAQQTQERMNAVIAAAANMNQAAELGLPDGVSPLMVRNQGAALSLPNPVGGFISFGGQMSAEQALGEFLTSPVFRKGATSGSGDYMSWDDWLKSDLNPTLSATDRDRWQAAIDAASKNPSMVDQPTIDTGFPAWINAIANDGNGGIDPSLIPRYTTETEQTVYDKKSRDRRNKMLEAISGGKLALEENVGDAVAQSQKYKDDPYLSKLAQNMASAGVVFTGEVNNAADALKRLQEVFSGKMELSAFVDQANQLMLPNMMQSMLMNFRLQTRMNQASLGVQELNNPLTEFGTGIPGGATGTESRQAKQYERQIEINQNRNVMQIEAAINSLPDFQGGWKQAAHVALDDVTNLGKAVKRFNEEAAQIQVTQAMREYSHEIYLAQRQVSDLAGLTNQANGSELGQLERKNLLSQRRLQLMQLEDQQRNLNYQRAMAGFTYEGATPEEAAMRWRIGLIRTKRQQQELDINKGMTTTGFKIVDIQNLRAFRDALWSLNNMELKFQENRKLQSIAQNLQRVQRLQGDANERLSRYLSTSSTWEQGRIEFIKSAAEATGKVITDVMDAATKAYLDAADAFRLTAGLPPLNRDLLNGKKPKNPVDPDIQHAAGTSEKVSGATSFIAGEAGTEHLLVLRNPRYGSSNVTPWGNAQQGDCTININASVRDDRDVKAIASEVERILNRKASVYGLRRM